MPPLNSAASASGGGLRSRVLALIDRHPAFDHCRAVLPWFQFARSREPVPRLRKMLLQMETASDRGRPPNFLVAFFFHVPVSLRQIGIALSCHGPPTRATFRIAYHRQFADLLYLSWRLNHSPHDYYLQKMWLRPDRRKWAQFLQQREHVALVKHLQRTLPVDEFDNKLNFFRRMKAAGIPTIEVLLAASHGRWLDEFTTGRRDEILQQDLVIKPVDGAMYDGVQIWRYDRQINLYSRGIFEQTKGVPDRWISDESIDLDELLGRVLALSEKRTYIVQGRIYNLPSFEAISPHSIANFRIVTARHRNEVRVIAALLRMGYDSRKFIPGSYQANIDLETGMLGIATGREAQWGYGENHLESGHRITGYRIENWAQLKATAVRGHEQYPWMPTIGWDVIQSGSTPLLREANAFWGVDIAQVDAPFLGEVGYGEACLEACERESRKPDEVRP